MPTPSSLAFRAANVAPGLVRALLRVWAIRYADRPNEQHWLFHALRTRTGASILKRFQLPTGHTLYADPFQCVAAEIRKFGSYEPEMVALLRAYLEPGMTYIDAGANIGHHALVAASFVGPTGSVHAFEPLPATCAVLRRNVTSNRMRNVSVRCIALSDRMGSALLHLSDDAACNSLGHTTHSGTASLRVELTTLDDESAALKLEQLDFLKIDVEGAELLVLRGGAQTIVRHRPVMVLEFSKHTEAFGYTSRNLSSYLESLGYRLFRVGSLPLGQHVLDDEALYYNVFAVPAEKLASVSRLGIVRSGA